MKVAFVKQLLDTFGPWSTVRWGPTSHQAFLDLWAGKALHWELTTLLQADWYVVPQQVQTDYTYDSVLKIRGHGDIVSKHSRNITQAREIPFDNYDLIITHDPILEFPRGSRTLFSYFLVEHWDRRYRLSLRRPLKNADLFLAHMMDAPAAIRDLPQAVSFPYLRDPQSLRAQFAAVERDEAIWADWRTISLLSAGTNGNGFDAAAAAAQRLQNTLQLPIAYRSFSMGLYYAEDPPRWGDAADYLRQLARQKYYLGLGRGGGAGTRSCRRCLARLHLLRRAGQALPSLTLPPRMPVRRFAGFAGARKTRARLPRPANRHLRVARRKVAAAFHRRPSGAPV